MRLKMVAVICGVALSLAGCNNGDGSDCLSAGEEQRAGHTALNAAFEDARACSTNDDCIIYRVQTECFQGCGRPVNRSETGQLQALAESRQDRIDLCDARPCPVPTCAPQSNTAVCTDNRCEFSPYVRP